MKTRNRQSVLMLLVTLLLGPAARSHAQFGPADAVGRALENAGRNIRRGVQNAIDATQGPVVVYENPLVARVHARLQWEKLLAGSTLELEVRDDGTAILRGEVTSKEAKERAFLLARDTIGINRVIDELRVPTSAAAKPVPEAEPESPALEPLPATPTVPAPPVTGPAATIRIRPSRAIGRRPTRSTTVIVRPAPVPVPVVPVVPAPVVEDATPQP
jgi:hypothetical protein